MNKAIRGFIISLPILTHCQDLRLALDVSPSVVFARVHDWDERPSAQFIPADGSTTSEQNLEGLNFTVTFQKKINKKIFIQSGLGVADKYLLIRNTDGTYSGVSKYRITYLHIPMIIKFQSNEFKDIPHLRPFGSIGMALELKAKENVIGPDYAHFWNMAKNRTWLDPNRGRNAKRKPVNLFTPLDLGIILRGGLEYDILEELMVHLSLTYQHNFINLIHPELRFDTPNKEKVGDYLSIKTSSLLLDIGFSLNF